MKPLQAKKSLFTPSPFTFHGAGKNTAKVHICLPCSAVTNEEHFKALQERAPNLKDLIGENTFLAGEIFLIAGSDFKFPKIGNNCEIGTDVVLAGQVTLQDHATLDEQLVIEDCKIHRKGDSFPTEGHTIIGKGVEIGRDCQIRASVGDGSKIGCHVKIWRDALPDENPELYRCYEALKLPPKTIIDRDCQLHFDAVLEDDGLVLNVGSFTNFLNVRVGGNLTVGDRVLLANTYTGNNVSVNDCAEVHLTPRGKQPPLNGESEDGSVGCTLMIIDKKAYDSSPHDMLRLGDDVKVPAGMLLQDTLCITSKDGLYVGKDASIISSAFYMMHIGKTEDPAFEAMREGFSAMALPQETNAD